VRQLLVSRALQYLDSLAQDSGGDANLQIELASAYRRVGDAQGRWNASNLGDPMGALASYRKGLQAAEAVRAVSPRRDDALREAGWLHLRIGEIYVETRDAEQARRQMEQGLALFRMRTGGSVARLDLAAALISMSVAIRLKDPAAAFSYLDQGGRLYEDELRRRPRDMLVTANLSLVDRYRALYGDRASQLRNLHNAEQLDAQRVAANPLDSKARVDLSIDLAEIGGRYLDVGAASDPAAALAYYHRALALREEVAAADPKDVMARTRVAFAQLAVARALLQTGRPSESIPYARQSLALLGPIVASNPANHSARAWMVEDYLRIGEAARRLGRATQACSAFRRGAQSAANLPSSGPADEFPAIRQTLSRQLAACAP
jgi:non-specific serine/threonine protein kinase/serine/threonine-protein kinase